ncbi:MAG: DUF1844 domain-containing protein [Phycisphaerales bacterium]|nr:MAG: DUF1844 domain-containing protein [Phycisphaerales bacterium]
MSQDAEKPKLHIDSDWKAEAQKEKERLAEKEKSQSQPSGQGGERGLPEASFRTLMSMLASQAIMGLGAMPDEKSGGVMIDLEGSRFSIDLLAVLEEKTAGNLAEEEAKELKQLISELRSRYVQIAELVAKQQAQGGAQPGGQPLGGQPGGGQPGGGDESIRFPGT